MDLNAAKRGFATLSQTVKERSGQVEDITELPEGAFSRQRCLVPSLNPADFAGSPPHSSRRFAVFSEYLELERRVDGLKAAHLSLLKVAKSYEGPYDYPVHINENLAEIGGSLAHNLSYWAAAATKGACELEHHSLLRFSDSWLHSLRASRYQPSSAHRRRGKRAI